MLKVIIQQLSNLIVSFFVLSLFTFFIANLFPSNLSIIQNINFAPSSESSSIFEIILSIIQSYFYYVSQILQGNFGFSTVRGTAIFSELFIYFPATLELSFVAIVFALTLGLPLGVIAAKQKNQWQDKFIISTTLVGYSIPIFWWAMLLVLLFSLLLGITPVASRIGFEYDIAPVTGFMLIDTLLSEQKYAIQAFYSALHHLVLPMIVLGTIPLAVITRATRSSMINVISQDYIRSAKARGISPIRITWKYAMRNSMIPLMTTLGLQIGVLITGSLLTETIFSWPGAGKWLLEAVYRRDFPVIHGGIFAFASFVILTHLFFDLALLYVDPKRRRK